MSTPQADYTAFWTMMAYGAVLTAVGIVLTLASVAWLFCGLIVISGLRKKTLGRILVALLAGPLLLRDSGFRN